jgi:hypothetical protein
MVKRAEFAELDGSPTKVAQQVINALAAVGANNISVDAKGARMTASMGMSWRSWGERISVSLTDQGSRTGVAIESKSWLKTALYDLGKNSQNVRKIKAALERPSPGQSLAPVRGDDGKMIVATLFQEYSFTVKAPQQFVEECLLRTDNWPEIAQTLWVSPGDVEWQGTPWAIGSLLVIKSGIGISQRMTVLQTAPEELFRVSTHSRLAGQTTISSYSLRSIDATETEVTGRSYVAGNSALAKKIAKRILSESSLMQTAGAKLARALETAWMKRREDAESRSVPN